MVQIEDESFMMSLCKLLGLESVAWKLRRLHCPVDGDALVLDIGSGGNPYPRANVLLDAYVETPQRYWEPLVHDRPTVIGFAENLPFRDKVFDFVIAHHVLEHSSQPKCFLEELQRVGKAGYIETPDAFMERVHSYPDHRSEVTLRDGRLLIRKKNQWISDMELHELYENRAKEVIALRTIPRYPSAFHVRYYWHEHIDYAILNPDADSSWESPSQEKEPSQVHSVGHKCYLALRDGFRTLFSQRRRNRRISLLDLLACPVCRSSRLVDETLRICCQECSTEFPVHGGMPIMYAQSKDQGRSR